MKLNILPAVRGLIRRKLKLIFFAPVNLGSDHPGAGIESRVAITPRGSYQRSRASVRGKLSPSLTSVVAHCPFGTLLAAQFNVSQLARGKNQSAATFFNRPI